MIILIGNSPSSGSTFLAHKLDSLPDSSSGPELCLFANKNIYDFKKFKRNPYKNSIQASIYKQKGRIYFHNLHYYGTSKDKFQSFVDSCSDLDEFAKTLLLNFAQLREKTDTKFFFEKSPENINTIGQFLNASDGHHFVHIVRNPIYVYKSLKKRGFSTYISLLTWYIDVLHYLSFKDHPRVLNIKYEDLVKQPAQCINALYSALGHQTNYQDEEIEDSLKQNNFRKSINRVKTWGASQGKISNANNKEISPQEKLDFSSLYGTKINEAYASYFDLPQLTFEEVLKETGYYDVVTATIPPIGTEKNPSKTFSDWLFLMKKRVFAHRYTGISFSQSKILTNPISSIR